MGHSRRFHEVPGATASPSTTAVALQCRERRDVPAADARPRNLAALFDHTSSARARIGGGIVGLSIFAEKRFHNQLGSGRLLDRQVGWARGADLDNDGGAVIMPNSSWHYASVSAVFSGDWADRNTAIAEELGANAYPLVVIAHSHPLVAGAARSCPIAARKYGSHIAGGRASCQRCRHAAPFQAIRGPPAADGACVLQRAEQHAGDDIEPAGGGLHRGDGRCSGRCFA